MKIDAKVAWTGGFEWGGFTKNGWKKWNEKTQRSSTDESPGSMKYDSRLVQCMTLLGDTLDSSCSGRGRLFPKEPL